MHPWSARCTPNGAYLMSELQLDWEAISRDLAKHLRAVSDLGLVRCLLDDAEHDAAHLNAPGDFWSRVLSDYDRLPASADLAGTGDVREMIVTKASR